ncbi:MAG: aldolase/citrate lyase family protein [Pseudomonadota bacterium]
MSEFEPLKHKLARGSAVTGCWLSLFSPLAAEIVGAADFDCFMVDLEHGPGSVMDAIAMMQAVKGHGRSVLARVPENNPVWLKRILDAGVHGVMIPSVENAAEARAAVSACRYAPKGTRGMAAPVVRATGYGQDWQSYVQRVEDDLLIICQIESPQAVEQVEKIAATEGLDMLFVGPFDLSGSLGHPGQPDHEAVSQAMERIRAAAQSSGKLLGTIPTAKRSAKALYAAGYDLILGPHDAVMLRLAAEDAAAGLREAAGSRS